MKKRFDLLAMEGGWRWIAREERERTRRRFPRRWLGTHRLRRVVWALSGLSGTLASRRFPRTPALLRATDGDESTRRPASSFLVAGGAVGLSALHDAELTTYNPRTGLHASRDPFYHARRSLVDPSIVPSREPTDDAIFARPSRRFSLDRDSFLPT